MNDEVRNTRNRSSKIMDNLLSNMDWGLYFPIIVTAIFQVVTLHPEAQPIYPSLETNMTL